MSSPIAIPRTSSESTSAASSTSSKYVPVHKRQASSGASPASSREPSPARTSAPEWRSHSPPSPQGRKFPTRAFAHHHHHKELAPSRTHIPQQASIPTTSTVPFVYSISDLLALSPHPAPLSSEQLHNFEDVVSLLALPINNDKAAVRRRRAGRRNSKAAQQKVVAAAVDVEARRTRHGHGTWGWQAHHEMESVTEPWRHAPVTVQVAV